MDPITPAPAPDHVVWAILNARLAADDQGRTVLAALASDPDGAAATTLLSAWLDNNAGPVMGTIVTGGTVQKLVNIARAENVYITNAAEPLTPHQLPSDISDFVNRENELALLRRAVVPSDPGSPARVVSVSGGAGVGKSAFAVHAAHSLAAHAADLDLYVDLRGIEANPLDPASVLERFLLALGTSAGLVPADPDERAAAYRTALRDRRALVVLDNARDETQVKPLLPGAGSSVALITSRRPLPGLAGAVHVPLDVFTLDHARQLLAEVLGEDRAAREPASVVRLAEACGMLPLALRIAGAKLAAKPHWTLARMAGRLADEGRKLTELEAGDLAVRASFQLSYADLTPESGRMFRLASLVPGDSFTALWLAAAADCDPYDAEDIAEGLVDLRLLEPSSGGEDGDRPRYRFHDLLRLFARERLADEESEDAVRDARERILDAQAQFAARALYLLSPHSKRDVVEPRALSWTASEAVRDAALRDPYAWFAAEYTGLVAGVEQAHAHGLWAQAHEITDGMHYFFRVRGSLRDWQHTHELARDANRRRGDRRAEAWTLRSLGNAHHDQGRFDDAERCFSDALVLFEGLDNQLGLAAVVCNLGELYLAQGRFTESEAHLVRCLPLWEAVDDRVGVAYTLDNLGHIQHVRGNWADADTYFVRAVALFRDLGDTFGEAHSLRRRALSLLDRGRTEDAVADLSRSREMFKRLESPSGLAWVLTGLGEAHARQGRHAEAVVCFDEALPVFRGAGDQRAAAWVLLALGTALRTAGRPAEAESVLAAARQTFAEVADRFGVAVARYQRVLANLALGRNGEAEAALAACAAEFRAVGATVWEERAQRRAGGS